MYLFEKRIHLDKNSSTRSNLLEISASGANMHGLDSLGNFFKVKLVISRRKLQIFGQKMGEKNKI